MRRFETTDEVKGFLWRAAGLLRGSVPAERHLELLVGPVFLAAVSERFDAHRRVLAGDLLAQGVGPDRLDAFLEHRDHFDAAGNLWVPERARWSWIAARVDRRNAARLLDDALTALMRENPGLHGVLPVVHQESGADGRQLTQLVREIDRFVAESEDAGAAHGQRPYEVAELFGHLLDELDRSERGEESVTSRSVRRLLVEMTEPYETWVYDPACGSGGLLAEAGAFARTRTALDGNDLLVGREEDDAAWRRAVMRLAAHGLDTTRIRRTLTGVSESRVLSGAHAVLTALPRALSVPSGIRHALDGLGPRGTAGLVLGAGSLHATVESVGFLRKVVEDDRLACVVLLPDGVVGAPDNSTCLWILTADKGTQDARELTDRRGRFLFIDARPFAQRTASDPRGLPESAVSAVAGMYRAWRGTASAREEGLDYADEPGLCASVDRETLRRNAYQLLPWQYTGPDGDAAGPPHPRRSELAALTRDLYATFG